MVLQGSGDWCWQPIVFISGSMEPQKKKTPVEASAQYNQAILVKMLSLLVLREGVVLSY